MITSLEITSYSTLGVVVNVIPERAAIAGRFTNCFIFIFSEVNTLLVSLHLDSNFIWNTCYKTHMIGVDRETGKHKESL